MTVVKAAEHRTIDLLAATGVDVARWDLPAELQEHHDGPPLTHDDLLDFHHLLYDDELFRAAIGALSH
jgi:hypothetical protein